ncbi:MAG: hypothetical protein COB15_09320 [Flavobacteriales bacterium]|nr:MAG: hypothetical protein COB15_09320 [Flavobacteriales bacterium]
MKLKLLLSTVFVVATQFLVAQSDNCATATVLTLNAAGNICIPGTTVNATSSLTLYGACNPTFSNNEVWYTFVTSGTNNVFDVTPNGMTNPEIVIYTGGCGATLETCNNSAGTGNLNTTWGIPPGTQVWIGIMSNQGTEGGFDFCINSTTPPPGGGNGCAGAIPLCDKAVTTTIDMATITSSGIQPDCFLSAVQADVWFTFTCTQTGTLEFQVVPTGAGAGTVELDWAMWDVTVGGCPGAGTPTFACNYAYDGGAGNPSGMGPASCGACPTTAFLTGACAEFCAPMVITAGQTYVIVMDYFTGGGVGFMDFNFLPGMTAQIAPLTDFTINPIGPTCATNLNVTITDNSLGVPTYDFGDGSPTYTGNNPPVHNYSNPGTYAITATIAGACPSFHTEFVELFGPVVTVATPIAESCPGACDGSISLATTGGSGNYTYAWNPPVGLTTPVITGLCDGNYSVTVTDAVCGPIIEPVVVPVAAACCAIDSMPITLVNCYNTPAAMYDVSGSLYFTGVPTTGTLTVTDCLGNPQVFNAPFTNPTNFNFTGLPQNATNCAFTAVFSADALCTITTNFMAPTPIVSVIVPNCQDSTVTVTLTGGDPSVNASAFTASNLTPATASFVNTTALNGGNIIINGLLNGDMYSFDVVDVNGCPITINGGPFVGLPDADAGADDTVCVLTYNLNATIGIVPGTWSTLAVGVVFGNPNSTTSSVTVATSGTYTFTWTEDNGGGCTDFDDVNITFSDLTFTADSTQSICGQANGSITVNVTGGIAPFQYSNNGGTSFQASNIFNGLTANTYNLVVIDDANCQIIATEQVTNSGAPIIDSLTTIDPLCFNDCNGSITVYASGGTNPLTYSIDGINFQASNTLTNLCGALTYTVTVQDFNLCIVTKDTILINPPQIIIDSIVPVNVSCNAAGDGTITVYAQGGTGTLEYSFDNGGTFSTIDSTNNLSPNTYYIVVRDANNCLVSDSVIITEPTAITIPQTPTNPTCFGSNNGQIILAPQGGVGTYTYAWDAAANNQVANPATNLPAGTFNITVTDASGCFTDSTFTLTEPPAFTYTTAVSNSNCNMPDGWATVINFSGGTGPYTYDWGAGPTPNDTLFNLIPGIYTVTITDAVLPVGCDTTFNITVGNNVGFTASITNSFDATCNGYNDGTATASGSNPLVAYTYNWYDASNQVTQTATGLDSNTYHVEVTDPNTGCVDTVAVLIDHPTEVIVSSTPDTICLGQMASLTAIGANGNGGAYTYNWNPVNFTGNPFNPSPTATTTYNVTAMDAIGCPSLPFNVDVVVSPALIVNIDADRAICIGESTTFSAYGTFGNGGPYSYSWGPGLPTTSTLNVSPSTTTTYTVTLDDGCTAPTKDSITVTVNPLPVIDFLVDDPTACESDGQLFTFHNIPGTTDSILTWSFGDGASISGLGSMFNPNVDTVTHPYPPSPGVYDVSLIVTTTSAAGQCSDTLTKLGYITIYDDPIADFTMNPNPTSMLDPTIGFFDASTTVAQGINNWDWNIAGLNTSTLQIHTYTFPEDTGHYQITLSIIDANECRSTITKTAIVTGVYGIFVPNAFTPDNDGLNDGFHPQGFGVNNEEYSFFIFDRWGELIYETHTRFNSWDGSYKGKIVQNGVYVWRLKFKDINGENHSKVGLVSIVR